MFKGFKFGLNKMLVNNIERWVCVQRICKPYLKINNLNSVVNKNIVYYHQNKGDKIHNGKF